jgi:hypothetical protein
VSAVQECYFAPEGPVSVLLQDARDEGVRRDQSHYSDALLSSQTCSSMPFNDSSWDST